MFKQGKAPLLEALVQYAQANTLRMHVPGHGGGRGAPEDIMKIIGFGAFSIDVTELPGLDDLNNPAGVIDEAQKLAAQAFNAEKSFFLVNGTTQGLHALIIASGNPGAKIIVPRNIHRSVVGGMILGGIEPVFAVPSMVPKFNFPACVPADELAKKLQEHSEACAVLCIHPTYHGVVGDLRTIANLVHQQNKPLMVDEAHGSHFYFHKGFPVGALQAGADAVVQSMHKTGGSLTQSSMLHLKGTGFCSERVAEVIRLIQTSSPSYVLMASLDASRRRLAARGRDLLQQLIESVFYLRKGLMTLPAIELFGRQHLDGGGVFDYDPSRVVIRVSKMGITGYQAAEWLMQKHSIYVEMADYDNIVLIPGFGISIEECRQLIVAIKDLIDREGNGFSIERSLISAPAAKQVMGLRDAWYASSKKIRLEESVGCICAEWLAVYPPGVPAILPGEEISMEMVNYLIRARESGAGFQGPADPHLNTIKIID